MTDEKPKTKGPRSVLAYTVSHGDRPFLPRLVPDMRGAAGCWFDWLVCLGRPSDALRANAHVLLHHPERLGIQYLVEWPENRGQHHATAQALKIAREKGYHWLLRIDDDIQSKTKRILKKMLDRNADLKRRINATLADDEKVGDLFVHCPRILRLKHEVEAEGIMDKGQKYPIETVPFHGGAFRLMPVSLLRGYAPPIYAPSRRGDPQSVGEHVQRRSGLHLRYRDLRVVHDTPAIEATETPETTLAQQMSLYWPFLECADV